MPYAQVISSGCTKCCWVLSDLLLITSNPHLPVISSDVQAQNTSITSILSVLTYINMNSVDYVHIAKYMVTKYSIDYFIYYKCHLALLHKLSCRFASWDLKLTFYTFNVNVKLFLCVSLLCYRSFSYYRYKMGMFTAHGGSTETRE